MRYITAKEMTKVDDLAVKKYNLSIDQMMELAGFHLSNFVLSLKPKKVLVFFGKGNNGGGGLVAAKHLVINGIKVEIIEASKDNNKNVKNRLKTLLKMGIKPKKTFKAQKGDIIIDSLLGYNIKGNPRGRYVDLINTINSSKAKVVSLDLPSGLDPTTGKKGEPTVKADYVLTLALPKTGLKKMKQVYLANLGIPQQLYKDMKINIGNLFEEGDIVRIS